MTAGTWAEGLAFVGGLAFIGGVLLWDWRKGRVRWRR